MRIQSLATYNLQCALDEPFGWSQDRIAARALQLVRVDTDAGISGWGECNAPAADALIHAYLAPLVLGEDPRARARLWQRMFHALYNGGLTGGIGGSAVSAIDTALWDIAGQACGLPVSELLGGALRTRIPVYATGLYYRAQECPDQLAAEALAYAEAGFLGMKTKVGGLPFQADVARVEALRRAIGPNLHLMVDANQAFDAAAAIRLGRALRGLDLQWFEEPVNALDLEGYRQVRAGLPDMPLAGGEVLRTRFECARYAQAHLVDILQPDVVNVGGITEMHRVIALANALGIRVYPHVWGSPVMIAASLHLASVIPPTASARQLRPWIQEPVMEFDQTPNPLRDELAARPFAARDGYVDVPTEPGLGVEILEPALERYCRQYRITENA